MCKRLLIAALSPLAIAGPLMAAEDEALEGREAVTTAKERLVNKAADPQRVDDCNVPAAKRDPRKTRSSDCAHLDKGPATDQTRFEN